MTDPTAADLRSVIPALDEVVDTLTQAREAEGASWKARPLDHALALARRLRMTVKNQAAVFDAGGTGEDEKAARRL
ncbi:MAG TPA: hypothetical protein RMF84_01305 [Polyangiaceae bacterium LLY-WYZ-14_1]|nr:hypothetical protein [Polyangiaceae bacterium LLY-WYZ-14_1]